SNKVTRSPAIARARESGSATSEASSAACSLLQRRSLRRDKMSGGRARRTLATERSFGINHCSPHPAPSPSPAISADGPASGPCQSKRNEDRQRGQRREGDQSKSNTDLRRFLDASVGSISAT